MITLNDYITASGKYPDRLNSPECTDEVKRNAEHLLSKVNLLLSELEITNATVSSGFRPSAVNGSIPGAAKKSLHMSGLAIDLSDGDGSIDAAIIARPDLLTKHGLWLEHPDATFGWSHLDCSTTRRDREVRVFRP